MNIIGNVLEECLEISLSQMIEDSSDLAAIRVLCTGWARLVQRSITMHHTYESRCEEHCDAGERGHVED